MDKQESKTTIGKALDILYAKYPDFNIIMPKITSKIIEIKVKEIEYFQDHPLEWLEKTYKLFKENKVI